MMNIACQGAAEAPVTLLPREVRLVVERILLLTPLSAGMVPAVRDVLLYSAASGLGGLPSLHKDFPLLCQADLAAIRLQGLAPGQASMDAAGQHSWMALPLALDALAEMVEEHGSAMLGISGALAPEELAIACAMGGRIGLKIFAVRQGGCVGPAMTAQPDADMTLLAAPGDNADPVLARALREGVTADAALWWELHHLSNTSLSPDTPESRRHAGPVIVLEDGRVIGRSDHDDDTDMSLLTEKKAS
jgi:hypothetical protein